MFSVVIAVLLVLLVCVMYFFFMSGLYCLFVFDVFCCVLSLVVQAAELEELNRKLRKRRWYHQQKLLNSVYVPVLFCCVVLLFCFGVVCLFVCVYCCMCSCSCVIVCLLFVCVLIAVLCVCVVRVLFY